MTDEDSQSPRGLVMKKLGITFVAELVHLVERAAIPSIAKARTKVA